MNNKELIVDLVKRVNELNIFGDDQPQLKTEDIEHFIEVGALVAPFMVRTSFKRDGSGESTGEHVVKLQNPLCLVSHRPFRNFLTSNSIGKESAKKLILIEAVRDQPRESHIAMLITQIQVGEKSSLIQQIVSNGGRK